MLGYLLNVRFQKVQFQSYDTIFEAVETRKPFTFAVSMPLKRDNILEQPVLLMWTVLTQLSGTQVGISGKGCVGWAKLEARLVVW